MQSQNLKTFLKSITLMQIFLMVFLAGISINMNNSCPASLKSLSLKRFFISLSTINIDQNTARELFNINSVVLVAGNEKPFNREYFNKHFPQDMLAANIQVLANTSLNKEEDKASTENPGKIDLPAVKLEDDENRKYSDLFDGQNVVLYCTHSAETYVPQSGRARLDGKRGLINNVARHLGESLQERGLKSDYINTIHDWPEYSSSYTRSRTTVQEAIKKHSHIRAVFDIHRDSIPGVEKAETVLMKGKKSARILIIVGTDERKPHPEWKSNLKFAKALAQKGEEMYPGLIKGIRTKAGTYNQEFHDHALLLEFGNEYNKLEEAQYAAQLFSDILVEVLREEVK